MSSSASHRRRPLTRTEKTRSGRNPAPRPAAPPSKQTARFVAIETLCQLTRTRLPVAPLFDAVATSGGGDGPDRHLAMNIVYGVLRQRQGLDSILSSLCRQPLAKLKPFVRYALLTGLYQIFFLHRVPESAAVNETVKAVQTAHLPQNLQGFVNGVLRESIRQKEALPRLLLADQEGRPILNHPPWLIQRWAQRYGQQAMERICAVNNQQAALTLWVNSLRISPEQMLETLQQAGIAAQKGQYSAEALSLPDFHGAVSSLPGFAEGLMQIQDEGAQLLPQLLTPIIAGGYYLDACAGLGGKTANLAQLCLRANNGASVVAVEPDPGRQQKFAENRQRLYPEAEVVLQKMTLRDFAASNERRFAGILVDAPCSGTGVIGRHPDIRWSRRASELGHYQNGQIELLGQAATLLAPQGVLVYATCSLEPEENEEVIALFLRRHPEFRVDDCTPFLPPQARQLVRDAFFAPLPAPGIDGFFGARLVRSGG